MTFRLAQISDTHLSGRKPFFVENFNLIVAALAASAPDLVVNTGDVSLDGAAEDDDLAEARRLHDAIGLPVRCIPGNHDVGESHDLPGTREPLVSAASRARYLRHFGDDFWHLDVPGWRLIAIDSQLLAGSLEAAVVQADFIAQAAASSMGRRLALLVHKPLFDASAAETAVTGRFVNPGARGRLLAAFGTQRPAVIASGHVHQYRSTLSEGARHIWAPSTGFIIPDARQPRYGEKEVGYVEHRFEADGSHSSVFVRVAGLKRLDIADFAEEAYGVKP
ncbi:MAG: metallophosphoesterase family protein [Hyphomicrobiaceae bacterium]|nr:metallophosphoesterase family protein [Hyphomicrobiaceae bacterium]